LFHTRRLAAAKLLTLEVLTVIIIIIIFNQSISQFIYLSRNAMHTGPDTKGGCNLR